MYSSKSDVWAFGVLLWEIMTLCFVPHHDISDDKEVARAVRAGERLPKPDNCPDDVYDIMGLQCLTDVRNLTGKVCALAVGAKTHANRRNLFSHGFLLLL